MFKKILTSLAVTLGVVTPSLAASENYLVIPLEATCVPGSALVKTVKEFGESATLTMISNREVSGRIYDHVLVLFVNYDTKTWTLAERIEKDLYCVIGVGNNIAPYGVKGERL